jgi:hypothetical protein
MSAPAEFGFQLLHVVLDLLGTAVEQDAPAQFCSTDFIEAERLCHRFNAS